MGDIKREIKYLVLDVDGTMTDGGIYYDDNGIETKKFCTKDAAGFFAAHVLGIKIVVMTGRECYATTRRMNDLGVDYLFQNIKDKATCIKEFMLENRITKEEIGYIGDDLNDLEAMMYAGFIGCPQDSCSEVKEIADYVSPIRGGYGAGRDVIEHILRNTGEWDTAVSKMYK